MGPCGLLAPDLSTIAQARFRAFAALLLPERDSRRSGRRLQLVEDAVVRTTDRTHPGESFELLEPNPPAPDFHFPEMENPQLDCARSDVGEWRACCRARLARLCARYFPGRRRRYDLEAVVAYGAFEAPLMRKPASNGEHSTTSAAVT